MGVCARQVNNPRCPFDWQVRKEQAEYSTYFVSSKKKEEGDRSRKKTTVSSESLASMEGKRRVYACALCYEWSKRVCLACSCSLILSLPVSVSVSVFFSPFLYERLRQCVCVLPLLFLCFFSFFASALPYTQTEHRAIVLMPFSFLSLPSLACLPSTIEGLYVVVWSSVCVRAPSYFFLFLCARTHTARLID